MDNDRSKIQYIAIEGTEFAVVAKGAILYPYGVL